MTSDVTARLSSFAFALERLDSALAQERNEWTRDAAVHRLKCTYELAWKCVAAAAQIEGVDVASPRRAWQSAFRLGWIDDDRLWLDMLEDRNRASHSYREATANQIRARLPAYATALRALLLELRKLS